MTTPAAPAPAPAPQAQLDALHKQMGEMLGLKDQFASVVHGMASALAAFSIALEEQKQAANAQAAAVPPSPSAPTAPPASTPPKAA